MTDAAFMRSIYSILAHVNKDKDGSSVIAISGSHSDTVKALKIIRELAEDNAIVNIPKRLVYFRKQDVFLMLRKTNDAVSAIEDHPQATIFFM